MMNLLEQINRVIDQLKTPEDILPSASPEASSEPIQQLTELLCEVENSTEPETKPPLNSTQEIHHLTNLLLQELESCSDRTADESRRADEIDRLLDMLFTLVKSYETGDFYCQKAVPNSSGNSLNEISSDAQFFSDLSLENYPEYSGDDFRRISEFFQSFPGSKPEKKQGAVSEITAPDPLGEVEFSGVNQPPMDELEKVSPRSEPELQSYIRLESEPEPEPEPEQCRPGDPLRESPQVEAESLPEPDLEEVARSLEVLRQLMFSSQSPQTTQPTAVNSENVSIATTNSWPNSPLEDEVSSAQKLENYSDDRRSSISEDIANHGDFSAEATDRESVNNEPINPAQINNEPINPAQINNEPINLAQINDEPINSGQNFDFVAVEVLAPLKEESLETSSKSDFEMLQSLLVKPEVDPLRKLNQQLDQKLSHIDRQINNPQNLINLLMPVIAELLSLKVEESKEDISRAIAPIIDQAIQERSQQDKSAMSAVLATLIPEAISYQIKQSPEDIAKAIAPEIAPAIREQIKLDRAAIANVLAPQMGDAIKEQIKLEQEAMVDALYPVIGSTVARYIAEAIKDINEKIAKALSGQTIRRKIQAKLQGVSEGELIFKEAIASRIQGVFLIHKQSGLIISKAQPSEENQLESEMVGGMLTAIRSFVNDCIVQTGEVAELDDIEYGLSTIKLEVAGYCYLAVLIKGDHPPKQLVAQIRETLSKIVLYHSNAVQEFDGDPDSVPQEIHQMLHNLIAVSEIKKHQNLPLLQLLITAIVGLIFLSLGWHFYQNFQARKQETQVLNALDTNPELRIYPWTVQVDKDTVTVRGKVPNPMLRSQAETLVKNAVPTLKLNNQIIAPEKSSLHKSVEDEVNRVAETLNKMAGISITVKYVEGKVNVEGTVIQERDSQNIAQAFGNIPGVTGVVSAIQLQPLSIDTRIYFEQNSSTIKPEDVKTKLVEIQRFLTQYPQVHLNIVGYSDRTGQRSHNQVLALQRAETVQKALISMGIAPERLNISANPEPPIDVDRSQPQWQHRSVIFYPVIPHSNE
jgi:outer membrane protein OmpA-like peptidoglycan-associated protein